MKQARIVTARAKPITRNAVFRGRGFELKEFLKRHHVHFTPLPRSVF